MPFAWLLGFIVISSELVSPSWERSVTTLLLPLSMREARARVVDFVAAWFRVDTSDSVVPADDGNVKDLVQIIQ